jgi:hypothetical protein
MLLSTKVSLLTGSSHGLGTRLRPAGPTSLVRETPPEGMMIGDKFIPGSVTSMNERR